MERILESDHADVFDCHDVTKIHEKSIAVKKRSANLKCNPRLIITSEGDRRGVRCDPEEVEAENESRRKNNCINIYNTLNLELKDVGPACSSSSCKRS